MSKTISPGIFFEADDFHVKAFPVYHRSPDSLGYLFEEKSRRPFLVEKAEALGITPHMDGKRFAKLVAIFTTKGNARFTVCKSRKGEVLQQWDVRPASLVLLRAPGFAGLDDGRPFHMVEGPKRGERYSIAFRLDTK